MKIEATVHGLNVSPRRWPFRGILIEGMAVTSLRHEEDGEVVLVLNPGRAVNPATIPGSPSADCKPNCPQKSRHQEKPAARAA